MKIKRLYISTVVSGGGHWSCSADIPHFLQSPHTAEYRGLLLAADQYNKLID